MGRESLAANSKLGWHQSIQIESSLLLNQYNRVVNQEDGLNFVFGYDIKATARHFARLSEWRNEIALKQQFQRDPVLSRFTKVADENFFETTYFQKWKQESNWGGFGRARIETSFLPSYNEQSENKTYQIEERDGDIQNVTAKRLKTARAFQPLKIKEIIGLFYRPIQTEILRLEVLTGASFRQNFTEGQRLVKDGESPPDFSVSTLGNSYLAGSETSLRAEGKMSATTEYLARAEWMMPLYDSQKSSSESLFGRSSWLTALELRLSFADWIKLVSETKLWKEPQIQEDTQFSQAISLKFSLSREWQP